MNLQTAVAQVGRSFKLYSRRLEKLGIKTLEDLLYHIPFRYEDYSLISKIDKLQAGEIVTIQGTVVDIKNNYTRNFKTLQKAKIADETGAIEVVWFNQPFLTRSIQKNDQISLSGKVDWFANKLSLQSPEYEFLTKEKTIHTGRLVPVYPETRGVSSKWLRRQIYKTLSEFKKNLIEHIPDSIIADNSLMRLKDAIEQIHFPDSLEKVELARKRLSFDELFLLHLSSTHRKSIWRKTLTSNLYLITSYKKQIEEFWKKLPFTLTNAQKRVVGEIFKDLATNKPMNRLLEGDVGSGKTVVSAIAMFLSYLNGFQSVLMAPTEILAQQHYKTISQLLSPFGVKVSLTTGSIKYNVSSSKYKKKIHNTKYILHDTDVLVGTHAVLQKNIKFNKLGLVVIDEQQRFGVEQRAIIRTKGKNPHLLTMTATPIPRTIALTMYGDLDLSILDEMPFGRKLIKTWLVEKEKRMSAYAWIEKQIKSTKSQAFIICPFIEESETMQTVKAAAKEFENLRKVVFRNLKLGLLHGKLKSKEKDDVLEKFRDGKIDILVSTPVVEVGIDIPNATIIVIEASERFGLAQLHQLRGRVGRGNKQSYCLLFSESKSPQTLQRLKAMEKYSVGAELAELDLKMRGPGELYGTMQHGRNMLKIASFSDFELVEKTKIIAQNLFPDLDKYPLLKQKLNTLNPQQVSPD